MTAAGRARFTRYSVRRSTPSRPRPRRAGVAELLRPLHAGAQRARARAGRPRSRARSIGSGFATLPGPRGATALYNRIDAARVERVVVTARLGGQIVREFVERPGILQSQPVGSRTERQLAMTRHSIVVVLCRSLPGWVGCKGETVTKPDPQTQSMDLDACKENVAEKDKLIKRCRTRTRRLLRDRARRQREIVVSIEGNALTVKPGKPRRGAARSTTRPPPRPRRSSSTSSRSRAARSRSATSRRSRRTPACRPDGDADGVGELRAIGRVPRRRVLAVARRHVRHLHQDGREQVGAAGRTRRR